MRKAKDLSRTELTEVVSAVLEILFVDFDERRQLYWNPDKDWNGADVCQDVASVLRYQGLVPDKPEPY